MTEGFALRAGVVAVLGLGAAGCAQQQASIPSAVMPVSYTTRDRDCMARAMYFESHRTGEDGMLAVGTVVANRVKSGRYGSSVCEVVAQKGQFAAGLMSKPMDDSGAERARKVAGDVLGGKRHPGVKDAMFFHTAGLRFHYPNMHYVLVAGGNAFYEKREAATDADARENARSRALALAYARVDPAGAAKPILVASADRPAAVASVPAAVVTTAAVANADAAASVRPATIAVPAPRAAVPAEPQLASAPTSRPAPVMVAATAKPRTLDVAKVVAEPALASMTPPAPKPVAVAKAVRPVAPAPRVIEVAKTEPAVAPAVRTEEGSAFSRVASAFSSIGGSPSPLDAAPAASFAAPAYSDGR